MSDHEIKKPELKWNHILDVQPEHGRSIVRCEPSALHDDQYRIGMTEYHQYCSRDEILKYRIDNNLPEEDWWWIYSEDFPWPHESEIKRGVSK